MYDLMERLERELNYLYEKLNKVGSDDERKAIQTSIQTRNLLMSRLAPNE